MNGRINGGSNFSGGAGEIHFADFQLSYGDIQLTGPIDTARIMSGSPVGTAGAKVSVPGATPMYGAEHGEEMAFDVNADGSGNLDTKYLDNNVRSSQGTAIVVEFPCATCVDSYRWGVGDDSSGRDRECACRLRVRSLPGVCAP